MVNDQPRILAAAVFIIAGVALLASGVLELMAAAMPLLALGALVANSAARE